jgi:hypothetical protein
MTQLLICSRARELKNAHGKLAKRQLVFYSADRLGKLVLWQATDMEPSRFNSRIRSGSLAWRNSSRGT